MTEMIARGPTDTAETIRRRVDAGLAPTHADLAEAAERAVLGVLGSRSAYMGRAEIAREILGVSASTASEILADLEANFRLSHIGGGRGRRWRRDKLLRALERSERRD